MSATPRPWDIGEQEVTNVLAIVHKWMGGSTEVAQIYTDDDEISDEMRANADLIVRAVNAFDALLAVARQADVHLHGKPGPRTPGSCCSRVCELIDALDAAFPDWREWPT